MNIFDTYSSGVTKLNIQMLAYMFEAASATLDTYEESNVGTIGAQMKLKEVKEKLIELVSAYRSKDSIFFIFVGKIAEENLKLVISTVQGKPTPLTKRMLVEIKDNLSEVKVEQLSTSEQVFNL